MILMDERAEIAGVAERWKVQYCRSGKWGGFANCEHIYQRLSALSADATAADVAAVIGNDTWIGSRCSECRNKPAIVMVGQEPDYDSATVWLCVACVSRLTVLVANLVASRQEPD